MNKNDKQFIAQKIRAQYMEKQITELDELRALDRKVKRPVSVFAYIFGSISAVTLGMGMSLIMTDIADVIDLPGDPLTAGIIIGCVGLCMVLLNYPMYKALLMARRTKYAPEILRLCESVIED